MQNVTPSLIAWYDTSVGVCDFAVVVIDRVEASK